MLIIGCGFHRQIDARSRPLASWPCLLQRLADSLDLHPTASLDHPTFFWEELILRAGEPGAFGSKQANRIEQSLKAKLVKLLNVEAAREAATYERHSLLSSLATSFAKRPGHIMSLNFDPLILKVFEKRAKHRTIASYGGEAKGKATDKATDKARRSNEFAGWRVNDRINLFRRVSVFADASHSLPTQVWFPHGTVKRADTLRLGFRDYGFQPIAYHQAFRAFKAWERKVLQNVTSSLSGTGRYEKVLAALQKMDRESHDMKRAVVAADHWVTRFMLSDVTIIGARLGPAETGLHWLLV
jgi:hypothetical protein